MTFKIIFTVLLLTNFNRPIAGQYDEEDEYGGGYGGGGDPYENAGGGDKMKTPIKEISSVDDLKKLLSDEGKYEPIVVGFFDQTTNKNDLDIFEKVASKAATSFTFAVTTEKEVLEEYKYDGCAVIIFKPSSLVSEKYEKPKSRYPSKTLKLEPLEKFLYDKSGPLVGLKSFQSSERLEKAGLPILTLFVDVDLQKNPKTWTYYANRLRKIAQDYKTSLSFEIASKSDFSYELSDYDIELASKTDVGVGIKSGDMYYKMTGAYSPEAVKKFVDDFLAGGLEGKKKKAPAPPKDEEGGDVDDSDVVKLNDSNFDSEVTSSDKDVMVEFYAPWCGHCKALKPTYATLATKLKDVPTVTVAAMDATAATVPKGYEVQGYPTILFVPADSKKPIPYDGDRDADAMAEWIQKHASKSFTL